jgi:hypothetical protein
MYMENIPHHKDFTRSKPGDVSAFLCHFLDGRSIKPKKVLRAVTFDAFALQALCEADSSYMPATVVSDTDSDTQSEDSDSADDSV